MDGLDSYLGRKKTRKQVRAADAQQAYETLCLAFPGGKVPFENARAQDPLLLTWLQSEMSGPARCTTVPVPPYWRSKAPRGFYNVQHCIPRFIRESGLVEMRSELYSSAAHRRDARRAARPRLGRMCLNLQRLHDCCTGYPFRPVLDTAYDGTDSFFLRSCTKGAVTDELREALGDLPAFLQNDAKELLHCHGAAPNEDTRHPAGPGVSGENERNTRSPDHPYKLRFQERDGAAQTDPVQEKEHKAHAKVKRFKF